jgi:UDP-N-acetylmuramyl tripeptide synthase
MDIIRDILSGIKSKPVYIDIERPRAVESALLTAKGNEIIAIIGKGTEKYYVDKSGYHKYDEIEHIKKVLEKRSERNENKA